MSKSGNLLYFLRLNKNILTNQNWLISIGSYIIKRVFLMFFVLYMVSIGYTNQETSFYYFILFFSSFLFVFVFNFFKHQKEILNAIIISSLGLSVTFLFNHSIIAIGCSVLLLFMFSEIYIIKGINSLTKGKEIKESQDTIAISTLYTILMPSIFFFLVGLFSDKNNDNFLYFIIVFQFIIGSIFLFTQKELKNVSNQKFNVFTDIPIEVHAHTFLTFLYSSISFLGRFILLPTLMIEISSVYGFEDNLFMVFGIFIGLMSVTNLIYDSIIKSKEINYYKLMSKNVTFLSLIWLTLSISYLLIMNEYISGLLFNIVIVINIITILLVDYFSKLWSIGMLNSLKEHSNDINIDFNKSLFLLNIHKNLGFSIGFLFVFLLYDIINFSFIISIVALTTIIYANLVIPNVKHTGAIHAEI